MLLKLNELVEGEFYEFELTDLLKRPWFILWMSLNYGKTAKAVDLMPKGYKKIIFSTKKGPFTSSGNIMQLQAGNQPMAINQIHLPNGADITVEGRKATNVNIPMLFGMQSHGIGSSGWDPEIFVVDEKKELIPAFSFLPNKNHGVKTGIGNSTAYYDGFQAEFTTHPVGCHGHGVDYLRLGLKTVWDEAQKVNKKARLSLQSVFRIPQGIMRKANPEFVALGCKPSLNAYGTAPLVVEDPYLLPYRVAGGHIHFATRVIDLPKTIKTMDLMLGIPTVAMFADIDNPIRREFYGRAGEHRVTGYGFEYRTLSNAWLCAPEVTHLVMDMARRSVGVSRIKQDPWEMMGIASEKIQEIINYCDVKAARAFVEKNWDTYIGMLNGWDHTYVTGGAAPVGNKARAMREVILGGVGVGFPNYDHIEDNWYLSNVWGGHSNGDMATWTQHSKLKRYNAA